MAQLYGPYRCATEVQAHQPIKRKSLAHLWSDSSLFPDILRTGSDWSPITPPRLPIVSHLRPQAHRPRSCTDAGDDHGGEMTVFHFLNCAFLTFGPHVVYYSATPLYLLFPASSLSPYLSPWDPYAKHAGSALVTWSGGFVAWSTPEGPNNKWCEFYFWPGLWDGDVVCAIVVNLAQWSCLANLRCTVRWDSVLSPSGLRFSIWI